MQVVRRKGPTFGEVASESWAMVEAGTARSRWQNQRSLLLGRTNGHEGRDETDPIAVIERCGREPIGMLDDAYWQSFVDELVRSGKPCSRIGLAIHAPHSVTAGGLPFRSPQHSPTADQPLQGRCAPFPSHTRFRSPTTPATTGLTQVQTTPRKEEDVNNIQLTGRLARDPEPGQLPDGTPITTLRIVVHGMGRGDRDQPGYIEVVSFGPGAAAADKVL